MRSQAGVARPFLMLLTAWLHQLAHPLPRYAQKPPISAGASGIVELVHGKTPTKCMEASC